MASWSLYNDTPESIKYIKIKPNHLLKKCTLSQFQDSSTENFRHHSLNTDFWWRFGLSLVMLECYLKCLLGCRSCIIIEWRHVQGSCKHSPLRIHPPPDSIPLIEGLRRLRRWHWIACVALRCFAWWYHPHLPLSGSCRKHFASHCNSIQTLFSA